MLVTLFAVFSLVVSMGTLVYATLALRAMKRLRATLLASAARVRADDLTPFDLDACASPEIVKQRREAARAFLEDIERPKGFPKKPARS